MATMRRGGNALTPQDQQDIRDGIGLGTAATTAAAAYATAAQGTDAREWTAATVSQAEAEAGTATTRRAWTAQRVRQAVLAAVPGAGIPRLNEIAYVSSGLTLPASGALSAQISSGDASINGIRILMPATAPGFTASRDNYVDLVYDGMTFVGSYVVTPVVISAAAPAIPPNGLRLGFVRTGATTITSATVSALDSLGNWMRNEVPFQITSLYSEAAGSTQGNFTFPTIASVAYDNARGFDPGSPTRITALYSGVYFISGGCITATPIGGPSQYFLQAYINGVVIPGYTASVSTNNAIGNFIPETRALVMRAGDYVEILLSLSAGTVDVQRRWMTLRRAS